VSVRLGDLVFAPSVLVLPFAAAFFLTISWRRLFPGAASTRGRTFGVLLACCVGGVAGAWLHGRFAGSVLPIATTDHLRVPLGSFGGYWGVLVTAAVLALAARHNPLRYMDALVPGILVGGAVARIGCVYTGCCPGNVILWQTLGSFQPFRPWALYDLAALLVTAAMIERIVRRRPDWTFDGARLCLFCLVYGGLRFLIEFGRATSHAIGPFTWGHIAALLQMAAGIHLLNSRRPSVPHS